MVDPCSAVGVRQGDGRAGLLPAVAVTMWRPGKIAACMRFFIGLHPVNYIYDTYGHFGMPELRWRGGTGCVLGHVSCHHAFFIIKRASLR